jgi:hypothetical protein
MPINRDQLIQRLAEVSHLTYLRQKNRDQGVPLGELTLEVTDHDRERAEDIVAELERLGILDGSTPIGMPEHPEPTEPPQPQSSRQRLTDIWGYPIAGSRRRRR